MTARSYEMTISKAFGTPPSLVLHGHDDRKSRKDGINVAVFITEDEIRKILKYAEEHGVRRSENEAMAALEWTMKENKRG